MAHNFGAPVTVTAQAWVRNASSKSKPGRSILDVIDGIEQAGIGLDLTPRQHLDRAGHADPRLVVAIDVRAHIEFEFVFLRIQQLPYLFGIADRIYPARDGAGNRTVSIRRPSERTNISGEAETRNSPSPRFISAP